MWLLCALLSAVCFGLRGILYQWSSQKPIDRNLMLFGVFSTGAVGSLAASWLTAASWPPAVLFGILMGFFSFLANAAMYKGFEVAKAALIAFLVSLASVADLLLALVLWGEKPNLPQWIAFVVVVAGVLLVRYSGDISLKNLRGAHWGVITMLLFSFTDLTNKQATLLAAPLFPTLSLMFMTGAFLFCGTWLAGRIRPRKKTADAASASRGILWNGRKTYGWGLLVGVTNMLGMVFIYLGFTYGVTGLVAAVVSVNVVLIILYAWVFLKEKTTPLEIAGMSLALFGVVLLGMLQ